MGEREVEIGSFQGEKGREEEGGGEDVCVIWV